MLDSLFLFDSSFLHLMVDTEAENCEQDRSNLKRRLAASAVEVERQVINGTRSY